MLCDQLLAVSGSGYETWQVPVMASRGAYVRFRRYSYYKPELRPGTRGQIHKFQVLHPHRFV